MLRMCTYLKRSSGLLLTHWGEDEQTPIPSPAMVTSAIDHN